MNKDKFKPGIYIPHQVMELDILASAKLLYGVFMAFPSFEKEGVWASRRFLGRIIGCKSQRITELVKILKDNNLVFLNGYKNLDNGNKIRLIKRTPPIEIPIGGQAHRLRGAKSGDLLIKDNNNNIYSTRLKKSCGSSLSFERKPNIRPSYYRFADQFQDKQIENHPSKYKQYSPSQLAKQIKNGGEVIDQLVRLDKWDFCNEIKPAIEWAIKDDFWSVNVRSLACLRNKGSNGESKFTNIFDGWKLEEKRKTKKQNKKKKFEDPRNPSRKVLRRGPDGAMRWED